jgi:penicillin-binding protein 2
MLMDDEAQMNQRVTRRAVIVGAGAGVLYLGLITRLGYLQLAQRERYTTLAEDNRISVRILPPLRGQIVDRFGVPLADNARNFRVAIIPEQARPLKNTLGVLQQKLGLRDTEVEAILKQAKKTASFTPIDVRDFLSWDQVATIEVNLPDLPGVSIEEGYARLYPFAESTAHLVGYVGAPSKDEVGRDPLLKFPGFRVGKSGMERALDPDLRGMGGNQEVEVNVVGRVVRELARREPANGERLSLSVDAELQQQLQTRLAQERSAAAVVMDVHTGEIYALASHPSFDPNQFSRQLTTGLWQELLNDITKPLANKAVAGQYPPGSTFKMVTALAALEAGIVDEHTTVSCPGHYNLGSIRFHCWKKEGHGVMNVETAIQQSCDTYFYEVGRRLGIERIAAMARRLGLGEKLGIELAEEQPGLVPDPAWKKTARPKDPKWHPGETINASIGQGYLLATPLQLATMTARLVNGGKAVKPWLVGYADGRMVHDGQYPDLGLKPEHLALVSKGMWDVVNTPSGTAYASRINIEGAQMGGKTGTSQVARITAAMRAAGVRNEDQPWHLRHHALFVAYAPADKPQYAMAVIVEHGVGGSKTAAPVAKDILALTLKRQPAKQRIIGGGS